MCSSSLEGVSSTGGRRFLLPLAAMIVVAFSSGFFSCQANAQSPTISTLAGTGASDFSGDGGQAASAHLNSPSGIAVDGAGNVYIADTYNNRVRKIAAATGIITTVAGSSSLGYAGDGGPATSARLSFPNAVAVDSAGNLYIADKANNRIRKVEAATGLIFTVAGNGTSGYSGDGGAATASQLNHPAGLAIDNSGNLYIADTFNHRIRKVTAATNIITTVAGDGTSGFSGDGGPANAAWLRYPFGVAVDGLGNMYIADTYNHRIRKVAGETITTVAGTDQEGYAGESSPATSARLSYPNAVAVDAAGNVYIADKSNNRIRKITIVSGIITTVAGCNSLGFGGDGGAATAALLAVPIGVAVDGSGNIYIADSNNDRVRLVTSAYTVNAHRMTTLAGTGTGGYSGDWGPAKAAQLHSPAGVAVDKSGNIYIADDINSRIRKITAATGLITTVAGSGQYGFAGDGGPATSARLYGPNGIAVDDGGNLYIADTYNHRVRKVTAVTNIITTVAGNGINGYGGDGETATAAQLFLPFGVAVDGAGNIYIADTYNHRIRKVTAATNIITTVAGDGTSGFSGDGGAANLASLRYPSGVAVDGSEIIYIADTQNNRIRKVTTGIITTLAGTDSAGFSGEAITANSAQLNNPYGVALDGTGNLYISDTYNSRIRKVTAVTNIITTVAGSGVYVYGGEGGFATAASINNPYGVAVDSDGSIIIAEANSNCVRKAISLAPDETALYLNNNRFKVKVQWATNAGASGIGHPVPLTSDSGYFWFFGDTNVELLVKILDGRSVNGNFWLFYGALTDVQYSITITDTQTSLVRIYTGEQGIQKSANDVNAFAGGIPASEMESALDPLEETKKFEALMQAVGKEADILGSAPPPGQNSLYLNNNRFRVEVSWITSGGSGQGTAISLTPDSGYFWFFGDTNVELLVKILDGRSVNGKFWVFYGALTDVQYTITVTDTQTALFKLYHGEQGVQKSANDVNAF